MLNQAIRVEDNIITNVIVVLPHQEIPEGYIVSNGQGMGETYNPDFIYVDPLKYIKDREASYPPIQEQLDMLYHDQMNSTSNWTDTITAIKVAHPKP